jgi:hypothetical protein
MNRRYIALAAVVAAIGLSGCGKLGALERPGPILKGKSDVDAGPEPARPVRTIDPRDPNSDPAPSRTAPIGGINNPASNAPQGALEDPYARPR